MHSNFEVRLVTLPPMWVASSYGFGAEPEGIAWQKMYQFMRQHHFWDAMEKQRFFGFNNPDPTPGSPNYGYEQWLVVPEGTQADGNVEIKHFAGGLYAVARSNGIPNIFATWQKLAAWREDSPHHSASHQWLEAWVNPAKADMAVDLMQMDCYLPIAD